MAERRTRAALFIVRRNAMFIRRRPRTRSRGLTLVELLVTISLLGLLMGAIGVAVFTTWRHGQIKTADIACARLREAAQRHFIVDLADTECPTPAGMKASREIDASTSTADPWGVEYRIACTEDEVIASSAGPDRAFGTDDDIRVPGPRKTVSPVASQR
jgi:general secretion pathway protein G